MSPKKKSVGFQSLRIIGRKAQKLLKEAREAKRTKEPERTKPTKTHQEQDEIIVHVSAISILRAAFTILAVVFGAWLVFHLRKEIIVMLLAVFVAAVIDPGVQAMERRGVPRILAILIQYFAAISLFLFLIISFIPIIAQQIQDIGFLLGTHVDTFLADPQINLPLLSDGANRQLTIIIQTTLQDLSISQFTDAMQQMGRNLSSAAQVSVRYAAQIAGSVLNFIFNFILVLALAFFIQLERERILKWTKSFFGEQYRGYINNKVELIHTKITQWARGQLLLCFSIFLLTLIALLILKMDYALTLALLAGFCEFIPAIGPILAAIPAMIIATTKGGLVWMLIIAGVYYVIQWCENNLLVPIIMKRAVGLSAVAIMFAMLVGVSFPDTIHPILGIIISIPSTTILAIFLEDWRNGSGKNQ